MSNKRLTNNTPKAQTATVTMGLDIGYGVTKAVTEGQAVAFPSVAGFARQIKFRADEIAAKYPGDQITDYDNSDWFVGNLALSQLKTHEQISLRGRGGQEEKGNEFRLRMAKVAIGKLFPNLKNGEIRHIRIATGLPVDHMGDADNLKQALIGSHVIQTDATNMVANITEVMVMPQPYGTIYRNMLTEDGSLNPCHTAKRTGVVDIGTYTIDVAVDDDGEYIDAESGSAEAGVYTAQERISEIYERDYREKPNYKRIEEILRKGVARVNGQPADFREIVAETLQPLRAATMRLLAVKFTVVTSIDVIYIAGGGAELVEAEIKATYPQAMLVDDPQFSNARGYLQYALFAARG